MTEDDLVARTEIAVVGDLASAYPDLTVREHLQLVAVAHGAGRGAAALVDRALQECRLDDHGDALPGSLSSGQLQALQLAAVLVRPRRLLVLDEPEQRLDPGARRWLAGLLTAEKTAGAALLLATHHTELAAAVADHAIVLSDGAVVAEGPPPRGAGRCRMSTVNDRAGPVAVPDSTGPTFALLRELRRGRARKQAASIAFWIYLALFIVAVWGGSLIVAAYRALRHPPPPTGVSLRVLHAPPAGLAALALLVLLLLVRDALWRGPVTVPGATVDWLLGTPVDRRRLLRPRFRLSAAGAIAGRRRGRHRARRRPGRAGPGRPGRRATCSG